MLDNSVKLILDQRKLHDGIISYYVDVMKKTEDQFAQLLRDQMPRRVYKDGPGDPDWIPSLQRKIQTIYRDVASDYIESGVGLSLESGSYELVRAMVIEAGAGSAVGNPAIQSKPGEMVWNGDLSGRHPSNAKTVFDLPEKFNQEGNQFVENAIKLMSKHFQDILDEAAQDIPDELFSSCLSVSIGGN